MVHRPTPTAAADRTLVGIAIVGSALVGALVSGHRAWLVAAAALAIAAPLTIRGLAEIATNLKLLAIPVAVSSITLLRLPVLFESQLVRFCVLVPFVFAMACLGGRKQRIDGWALGAVSLFVLLFVVAVLRGSLTGNTEPTRIAIFTALGFVVAATFAYRLVVTTEDGDELRSRLVALAFAPAFYAAANAALQIAGVTSSYQNASIALGAPAELLGLLGFATERISFPLGVSINNFGAICGIGLASCTLLLLRGRRLVRPWLSAAGAAVCLYVLLRGDSRVSVLAAITAVTAVCLLPRMRAASGLAVLIPLAPIGLLAGLSYLGRSSLGEALSSSGRDISSASGRQAIWKGIVDYLREWHTQDLFGYGAAGQITSGANRAYQSLFGDEFTIPAHNAFLQTVLDAGYVGAASWIAALFFMFSRLARAEIKEVDATIGALLAGTLTLVLNGFTEVVPSFYATEAAIWFVSAGMVAAALGAWQRGQPEPVSTRSETADEIGLHPQLTAPR